VEVDIISFGVGEKVCSAFDERHSRCLVISDVDFKKSTATDDVSKVFVCRTLVQVTDENSSLILDGYCVGDPLVVHLVAVLGFLIGAFKVAPAGMSLARMVGALLPISPATARIPWTLIRCRSSERCGIRSCRSIDIRCGFCIRLG
jgi:hypothetical protein